MTTEASVAASEALVLTAREALAFLLDVGFESSPPEHDEGVLAYRRSDQRLELDFHRHPEGDAFFLAWYPPGLRAGTRYVYAGFSAARTSTEYEAELRRIVEQLRSDLDGTL